MKKNTRRIIAFTALAAIIILIIAFAVSALTDSPGSSGDRFMSLLFCIIAIPILAWLLLFCISRMQHRHTIAELFPEHPEQEEKAKDDQQK